jgi:hypothetical protein
MMAMRRFLAPLGLFVLLAAGVLPPLQAETQWELPAQFPSNIEHGLQVMREPQLQLAMQAYNAAVEADPAQVLIVEHGKDELEKARAMELADWLVILGMPPSNIRLQANRKLKEQLRLQIDSF